jgi:hypothetical protein
MLGIAELDANHFDLGTQGFQDSVDRNLMLDGFHTSALPSDGSAPRQLMLDNLLSGDMTGHLDDLGSIMTQGAKVFFDSDLVRC